MIHFNRLSRLLCFFLFLEVALSAHAEDPVFHYQVQLQVSIPMRDGAHLNATVYRPVGTKEPLPVIFQLTPYPDARTNGSYYAAHGYVFAAVHVRGRGDSEGVFDPFAHDAQDGYDITEWFAKQSWCNGKVGMDGGSYVGADQFLVAAAHPPHLVTIVPVASARAGADYPSIHRIVWSYMTEWLALTSGHVAYNQVAGDQKLWTSSWRRWYLDKAPFSDLDSYSGSKSALFQELLKHPDLDDFWKLRGGTAEQVAAIHIPIMEITGINDGDENGALSFHNDHETDAGNSAQTYLLIGPWTHGGTRDPKEDVDMHFGSAGLVDIRRLELAWYDHAMKGKPRPAFLKDHVVYYVWGSKDSGCWRSARSLKEVSPKSLTLYLDATGGAKSIYQSGSLSQMQKGTQGGQWISDPNDLSGADPSEPDEFSGVEQPGFGLHGNGLVFHASPFTSETDISGRMDLRLWLSIDVPDTDLFASLSLVFPNGEVRGLTNALLRGRYRYSEERPEGIHENQPEEYRIPPYFPFISVRAPKGSQLRLVIEGLNNSALEKNWNSMKPVAEQTGADAHVAHIQLLQTPEHPSTLTLPLSDVNAECKASAEW